MSKRTHALSSFILRLAGHVPEAADDATAVFRSFADGVERRVGAAGSDGPKVRVAGGEPIGGGWR
ncbi:hypothetical protein [Chthonobacter albigriseus]|uniref:hypothetical protein n=1 Tax=Chthonobacter albigriseus TaxID=1683161 RepID=UPI0015EED163|nr:hypothetical protein [Chthonobacter albigriseus]